MKKVSIIVPVYNCESTIRKCVNSILIQTLDDLEIVLVDDGSTDSSGRLCDDFAEDSSDIKVIHKENGGLVSARKAGLKVAEGEYIGYVDSDDWIESTMYECLFSLAKDYDVDMASSGYIYEGGYTSIETDTVEEGIYSGSKRIELLETAIFNMKKCDLGIRGSLCCKLFKRSILNDIQMRIPEGVSFSEDKLCMLTFLLNCRSVYVTKKCFYHYVMNNSSMTLHPNTNYLIKVNEVYRYLSSLYDHPDFTDNMRAQAELYVTQLLIKGINSRMGFSVKNLMWIDDDWMYKVPEGSRILLFGEGNLCDTYMRQIKNSDRLNAVGAISDASEAQRYDFDYIVITYKYKPKADEIRKSLVDAGAPEGKILWFEQKEIFWKYARYAGLCGD